MFERAVSIVQDTDTIPKLGFLWRDCQYWTLVRKLRTDFGISKMVQRLLIRCVSLGKIIFHQKTVPWDVINIGQLIDVKIPNSYPLIPILHRSQGSH